MVRKVGIVGSSESHWTQELRTKAIKKIRDIFLDEASKETEKIMNVIGLSEEYKKTLFFDPYSHLNRILLISGRSPKRGIDDWAEIVADVMNVNKEIYPAEVKQWNDRGKEKGYESRNIQIATASNSLYCIDPITRKPDEGGGMWTLNYAKRLNKETHHVIIS